MKMMKLPPIHTPPIPRIPRIPKPLPLPPILRFPPVVHAAIPVLGMLALGGLLVAEMFRHNTLGKECAGHV